MPSAASPSRRAWLAEPDAHPDAGLALRAIETAGWRRISACMCEPYADGDRYAVLTYEQQGRVITLSLTGETSAAVHPHWFRPGVTVGFVRWGRLASVMQGLLDDLTRLETP
ncbi:hypothetical protein [Deinococcus multiflagellatus]|uniref:Uncharacterized protein n=1 Tax=Deinococcus multiflagellatus TaxID=1656887 RepID=A0ABW1ZNP5_9DEIO|nr:hypothetical protein [Deinococcus multiflagellatus]MBZ9715598.1 hypothetical protein [Deinococcus multiflagellatus]